MVKLLVFLSAMTAAVSAQIISPSYQFNVTSPAPNSPYVASQILPCIYDVASNATSDSEYIHREMCKGAKKNI